MIKIKAKIYLYKNKGRNGSFKSGYRPAFNFDGNDNNFFTGHIELINKDLFMRGDLEEVFITFITDNKSIQNFLKVGNTFSFNEPPIEVGEGEILDIISNSE